MFFCTTTLATTVICPSETLNNIIYICKNKAILKIAVFTPVLKAKQACFQFHNILDQLEFLGLSVTLIFLQSYSKKENVPQVVI